MAHYDALVKKWAALPPAKTGADVLANLAALNAEVVTMDNQPVRWGDAKGIARGAPTLDWSRIIARSRHSATLPPATAEDMAVLVAINATESGDGDELNPANERGWAAFLAGLGALQAVGDLSQDTVDRIKALARRETPWWSSEGGLSAPPNVSDLIAAGLLAEDFARKEGIS